MATSSKLTKMTLALTTTAIIAFGALSVNVTKAHAADNSFTNAQKKELGDIIHQYLLDNPEVIFEAADKARSNQEEAQQKDFETKRQQYQDFLYNNPDLPSVGSDNPDLTIVEFFDYNCGYCHKALKDVQAILKTDKKVRFVFVDMPILAPTSRTASAWALAAAKQGKYFDFHQAVMEYPGGKTEADLEIIGKKLGLDVDKLKKDAQDPEYQAIMDKNLSVAQDLGIRGTPGFIIGDYLARGYMGQDAMKSVIADTRAKQEKAESK